MKSCTSAWGGRTAREEVLALPFASTFLGHCIIEKVSYDGRSNLIFPITSTFKYKTSNDTQRTNQIPVGQKLKGGGYYDHVTFSPLKTLPVTQDSLTTRHPDRILSFEDALDWPHKRSSTIQS